VLQQLLNTSGLFQYVITRSSVTKGWLDAFKSLGVSVGVMLNREEKSFQRNITNVDNISQDWYDTLIPSQLVGMHIIDPRSTRNMDVRVSIDKVQLPDNKILGSIVQAAMETTTDNSLTSARRLLAETNTASDSAVFRYSALTAATGGFSNIPLASAMADNWLEGPFGWPPRTTAYDWEADQKCIAAQVTLGILGDTGLVMKSFFDDYRPKDTLSWNVLDNIPTAYTGVLPQGQYP
jgi:hypothetical protein